MKKVTRVTVVPLFPTHPSISANLPFQLDDEFSVADLSPQMKHLNLRTWNKVVSEKDRDKFNAWDICLQHRYETTPEKGEDEQISEQLMHYVLAHLRFIVPVQSNIANHLMATELEDSFDPLSFSTTDTNIILEDCEQYSEGVTVSHLEALKSWLPWIRTLRSNTQTYYPLYLSLFMAESSRVQNVQEIRHLLRVIALEALVSSDATYGMGALEKRIGALIGEDTNLYERYCNDNYRTLPIMNFSDVIRATCRLRNKIAHGVEVPSEWRREVRLDWVDEDSVTYMDQFREAATSMLSLSWGTIISRNLQKTIGDKELMESYFKSGQ